MPAKKKKAAPKRKAAKKAAPKRKVAKKAATVKTARVSTKDTSVQTTAYLSKRERKFIEGRVRKEKTTISLYLKGLVGAEMVASKASSSKK